VPLTPAQDGVYVPTPHPELIAGPWEVASASGIDGISFAIDTSSVGPTGREQPDSQTMNIRVYHREGGKETWGYFGTGTEDEADQKWHRKQDDSFTRFDGERLRIHFTDVTDLQSFDLDVTFSSASHEWSGTWSRSGRTLQVVLKRPEPNSDPTPNAFIGDWITESPAHAVVGGLHIRQSSDGALCAWSDRIVSGTDPKTRLIHNSESEGIWLKVNSAADTKLILDSTNVMGPPSQFRGNLSDDHQLLTGTWETTDRGPSALNRFRRASAVAAQ
jgi:hypothetical protein